ncbi:MAG TPA: hypothetical protein VNN62_04840 [Methylomirabilota bacterium]|jgi:hypothetical protein|nr:hypothetical protein [Methylomirabilota bacterium]
MKQRTLLVGAETKPPLLPEWAFVVQFREGADLSHGRVDGCAEHIVSGGAAQFTSLDELAAFMAQVLAIVRAPPSTPQAS